MNIKQRTVNAAAATTFTKEQRPMNSTIVLDETEKFIFSVHDSNQGKIFKVRHKKQSGNQRADLVISSNEAEIYRQWAYIKVHGTTSRI